MLINMLLQLKQCEATPNAKGTPGKVMLEKICMNIQIHKFIQSLYGIPWVSERLQIKKKILASVQLRKVIGILGM